MAHYGLIKNYDGKQGTGTITPEKGGEVLTFSKEGLNDPKQDPKPTQRYSFETGSFDGGKKEAVNLRRHESGVEQRNK